MINLRKQKDTDLEPNITLERSLENSSGMLKHNNVLLRIHVHLFTFETQHCTFTDTLYICLLLKHNIVLLLIHVHMFTTKTQHCTITDTCTYVYYWNTTMYYYGYMFICLLLNFHHLIWNCEHYEIISHFHCAWYTKNYIENVCKIVLGYTKW